MTFDPWRQSRLQNAHARLQDYEAPQRDTSLDDLKRLSGINEQAENISTIALDRAQYQREHNIQPGTDAWFKLWFSRGDLTGEKPY